MKKYFYIATACMLGLCSCSNDDDAASEEPAKTVFTATLESNNATRTCLETISGQEQTTCKVEWYGEEKIKVNGVVCTANISEEKEDKTKAMFTTEEDIEPNASGKKYIAYYPASDFGSIDEYQNEEELPMYAESMDTNLEFKNLFSILYFDVAPQALIPEEYITGYTSTVTNMTVTVKSDDKALYGSFSVAGDYPNVYAQMLGNDNNKSMSKTVEDKWVINASSLSVTETFCFPLPVTTYRNFTITLEGHVTVSDTEGTKLDKDVTLTYTKDPFSVERSTIYYTAFYKPLPQDTSTKGKLVFQTRHM